MLREIDARLTELERELGPYRALVDERTRLLAARAAMTGERAVRAPSGARRVGREEVVAYLREHPGVRAKQIAEALDVPLGTVSQHLYRGKRDIFDARKDGWYLRDTDDAGGV